MNPTSAKLVAKLLKQRRQQLGLSAHEVARRSGVNVATISRIEHAEIPSPRADSLTAIAKVLELPATDLFVSADWIPDNQLPTVKPYLRAKYSNLPPDVLAELEASIARVVERYGYDGNGPAPGEDET
jgi:transcriptional regulator with XRE-family HTH domain